MVSAGRVWHISSLQGCSCCCLEIIPSYYRCAENRSSTLWKICFSKLVPFQTEMRIPLTILRAGLSHSWQAYLLWYNRGHICWVCLWRRLSDTATTSLNWTTVPSTVFLHPGRQVYSEKQSYSLGKKLAWFNILYFDKYRLSLTMFMSLVAYTQTVSYFVVMSFQVLNLSWLTYSFPASPFQFFLLKSTIVVLVGPLCVLKVVWIVSIIS